MKFYLASAALLLAGAAADTCSLIDGYYYCNQVNQVQYSNVGFSGSYSRVTSMDGQTGVCQSTPQSFSGSLSPIDEELSVHFRGPIKLNKFATYTKSGNSKRAAEAQPEAQPEPIVEVALHHEHKRAAEPAYVTAFHSVTYYVTVDQYGNLLTAQATSSPAPPPAAAAPASSSSAQAPAPAPAASSPASSAAADAAAVVSALTNVNYNYNGLAVSSVTGPATITTSNAAPSATQVSVSGDWTQNSFYDADSASSNGLVFLNNLGGSGSGVFDYQFGNSLSYCAADGVSGASQPETLSSTLVPSNKEFIIFTDNKCAGDDCGYYREGIPAYHGYGGSSKIFLFDFEMPTESSVAPGSFNYDMPAIWLLNAQIPRTLQYGKIECSCWATGCGELDLFEVLSAGNSKMVTTLHTKQGGNGKGSSDYFARPTSGSMTAAVIFDDSGVTITTIPSGDFPASLDESTISSWTGAQSNSLGLVVF